MDFYMYHGRVGDNGPPTDTEGNEVDGWGFDGPRLPGVIGFHCTYGAEGHWNLWFESNAARDAARALTGWEVWEDNALTVTFNSDNSMVRIWNPARNRFEYFGDWGIK